MGVVDGMAMGVVGGRLREWRWIITRGTAGGNGNRCSFIAWSDKKRVLAALYTEDHYGHGIRLAHGPGVHSPQGLIAAVA